MPQPKRFTLDEYLTIERKVETKPFASTMTNRLPWSASVKTSFSNFNAVPTVSEAPAAPAQRKVRQV